MTQPSEQTTVWLTQKTSARLTSELKDLEGPKRTEVIARISAARDEGDLKENGGYHAAKDEQGKMEARIRQLKEMLSHVSTEPSADDGIVSPGKVVTYRYAGDDGTETFLLGAREIDDDETDIEVFSPQSPLGAALVGAATGETIDFEAPNGKKLKIEIVAAKPYTG
jgi:transcription elongation factor GreA